MLEEDERILVDGAQKIGIKLNKNQIETFSLYLDLLIEWNQKINLTSLKTPQEIIIKHFLDSLTCIKAIDLYSNIDISSIVDIGTGAGFPGIPIKIVCPSIELFLLEARKKKSIFLEKLTKELNLKQVQILKGRAETFGRCTEHREKYDIAISRAVAPLNILSEYCLPLVRVRGLFIAQKGRTYKSETEKGIKAIQFLGGELIKVEKIQIPFINQNRYLLVINKKKNTPLEYPRKEGLPQKRPLYF
ncbi:MAG: 16S rRNA (guanine(527)-N(7))-methyltransferase RsmG [Candidatus Atribacteria bacterium]|nr:16S rRNA (guanine(527)-N(7))-methyltransferase RsmG [Candidatus Atribacteria bacterium]